MLLLPFTLLVTLTKKHLSCITQNLKKSITQFNVKKIFPYRMKLMSTVRKISNYLRPYLKPLIGAYYGTLHLCIMFLGALIILFDTNLIHLTILYLIIVTDAMACVVLHNCPLTTLEKKYLGHSLIGTRMKILNKLNISYECNHEYESTVEFLTNLSALVIFKITILICVRFFTNITITITKN